MKSKPKMRTEKQLRSELEHQKRLASKVRPQNNDFDFLYEKYMIRVHLLSWILEESTTF